MTTDDSSGKVPEVRPDGDRMTLFSYQEAPVFWETDMLTELGGSAETLERYEKVWEAGQARGSLTKVLYRQAAKHGTSLIHVWQKPGKVTPRHSHDGDCLYYVIAGSLHMGNRRLGPGDGMFIPSGHAYAVRAGDEGVELLEFRPNATEFDMQLRDQSPEKWDEMAAVVERSQDLWAEELPPPSMRGVQS